MKDSLIFLLSLFTCFYFFNQYYSKKNLPLGICIALLSILNSLVLSYFGYYFIIFLINIFLFIVFYIFGIKDKKLSDGMFFLTSYLFVTGIFIYFKTNFNFHIALVLNYNVLLILIFFLLHLRKNKVARSFHILFDLSIVMITYISIYLLEGHTFISILLASLVFLLSENNQNFMRKNYEERVNDYQNKILQHQVDEVNNIYLTMRGWRHDYHNHLQTLKAHLAMKKYDLANIYLNELESDLDSIDTLVQSGNVNIDAILNSKLSLAISKQIEINFKASVPEKLVVSDIDLCVVIGNLLDNAVEACEQIMNQEHKFIRLYIGIFKKQLYISVTNSTKEIVRRFDEEYITSKRGNHGHGLKRINLIVNKYNGFINRKNEPGVFVTEIMLPL